MYSRGKLTERNEEDFWSGNVMLFFYRGRSGARVRISRYGTESKSAKGTLPRLKPKQEIEIPMFYNYLSC